MMRGEGQQGEGHNGEGGTRGGKMGHVNISALLDVTHLKTPHI